MSDLTYLPGRLLWLLHYSNRSSALLPHDDLYRNESVEVAFHVIREGLFLAGAFWFYKCVPWIQTFFSRNEEEEGL